MNGGRPLIKRCTLGGWLVLCCGAAPAAWAARPLVTDDASVLDPGQCQLETWVQRDPRHTHYWIVPACHAWDDWEVGVGAARLHPRSSSSDRANLALLQAKTVLAAPKDGWWRLGLAVADEFQPARGLAGTWSLNLPLTVDLRDDLLQWHTNLGWRRERQGQPAATWATALEAVLGQRAALTVEAFGIRGGGAWRQLGLRYTLLPGHMDLDVQWGMKAGSGSRERYYAAGLTIYVNPP